MRKIAEQICLLLSHLIFRGMRIIGYQARHKISNRKIQVLVLSNDVLGDAISRVPFFAALRRDMPRNTHNIAVVVRDSHQALYHSMPYFDEIIPVHMTFDRHPILWLLNKDMNWAVNRPADIYISCLKEDSLWQQFMRRLFKCKIMAGPGLRLTHPKVVVKGGSKYLFLPRIGKGLIADFDTTLKFLTSNSVGIRRLESPEVSFLTTPIDHLIPSGPYMAVVPGAGVHYRQWPIDRFIHVLKKTILEFSDMAIIVLGSGKEVCLGEKIREALPEKAHNLCGKTSFGELGGVLQKARVVLTNETGSATFAAVLGTPTVCILGGGDFGTYFPNDHFYPNTTSVFKKEPCFGCIWQCSISKLEGIAPCINAISQDQVLEVTLNKLRKTTA